VLDRLASAPRTIHETTESAIRGGVDAIVCRLKDTPDDEVMPLAAEIHELCRASETRFVMSHHHEVAVHLAADAVHIGNDDPPLPAVRKAAGADMAIGYSAHSIDEANQALAAGADYVFLGPIFATPAKLKYGDPLGLETARQAVRQIQGTLVCIGGINLDKLELLAGAGVKRVAAIAALQHDCDPQQRVGEFRRRLTAG
jgi:thiamine-phosphate pyrophosphorylase